MTLNVKLPYKNRKYAIIEPDKDGLSPCAIDWEYMQFVKIEGGISLRGKARSISPLNMSYKPNNFDASEHFPVDLIIDFYATGMKYRVKDESSGKWEDKQLETVSNFEKFIFGFAGEIGFEVQIGCTLNINDCNGQAQVGNYAHEEDAVKSMVASMLVSNIKYFTDLKPLPEPQEYGSGNGQSRYATLKEKLEKLDKETIDLLVDKAFHIRTRCGTVDTFPGDDPMESPSLKAPLIDVTLQLLASL